MAGDGDERRDVPSSDMNAKYRCAGCKRYKPGVPYRKIGLVVVCSEECQATVVGNGRRAYAPKPGPTRVRRPPDDIPQETRIAVMRRDRGRCRWCGGTAVHLHHIKYRSEGVDHSERNLILLCQKHHALVHSDKKKWKPVLLTTIEYLYAGRQVTVPQVNGWLERQEPCGPCSLDVHTDCHRLDGAVCGCEATDGCGRALRVFVAAAP